MRLTTGSWCLIGIILLSPFAPAFSGSAVAQEPAASLAGWTPQDMLRVNNVNHVRVSPDGRWVVYTVTEATRADERGTFLTHIHLASADGRGGRRLTEGDTSATDPQWSPDGRWIAFRSARSGRDNLWIMRPEGGAAEQLTHLDAGIVSFRWSPDGKRIAFVAPRARSAERRERERHVQVLDEDPGVQELWVVSFGDRSGKVEPRRLTDDTFNVNAGFDWSPDNRSIAFSHARSTAPGDPATVSLSVLDLSTATVRLLTHAGMWASFYSPAYSPNGRSIAFVDSEQSTPLGRTSVHLIGSSGGSPRRVIEIVKLESRILGWSADGESVYISERHRTGTRLSAIAVKDGARRELARTAYLASGMELNASRNFVGFSAQSLAQAPEAFVARMPNFGPVRVSDANRSDALPPLPRTEVIRWNSADGAEIEGLLTYPTDYRPGERYPLLVVVHAGGEGFTESYPGNYTPTSAAYFPPAVFASRGYAVLRANSRGGGLPGYGYEHSVPIFRPADKAFSDVMAGVDEVIAMGVADRSRLGIMGWSNGGLVTSWTISQTQRFRAASVLAGIFDLINSNARPVDAEFWDDMKPYLENSPIYHAKNISTPTLILHGEKDVDVPRTQGSLLYKVLKRRGVPTRLVVYPQAGHTPSTPLEILDIVRQNLQWFDMHLGPRPVSSR